MMSSEIHQNKCLFLFCLKSRATAGVLRGETLSLMGELFSVYVCVHIHLYITHSELRFSLEVYSLFTTHAFMLSLELKLHRAWLLLDNRMANTPPCTH